MGILPIKRNLVSKFKPKSLSSSSSDLCFFRRFFSRILSPAAVPRGAINLQQASVPKVVGDLQRNSLFLIEHVYKRITFYSQLSAAAAENNNSWKNQHSHICNPFSGRPGMYLLVGSCKELTLFLPIGYGEELLMEDKDGDSYFQFQRRLSIWNPATDRIKTLPPSLLPRPRRVFSIDIDCFGFGFDPKSQDYKLICFLQYDVRHISLNPNSPREVNIELYSLKTDSWKQITAPPDVDTPYFHFHSVHIDGIHYWARDDILSFDFANEKFSRISLPDLPYLREMQDHYFLAEFHGSLAVIVPYWVPTDDLTEEEKKLQMQQPFSIEIWVWNGETWNVAPRCAIGDFPLGDRITRVLAFFQNEYLFLQARKEAELMLFNCKTGKLEFLGIYHDPPESTFSRKLSIFPFSVPI